MRQGLPESAGDNVGLHPIANVKALTILVGEE